MAADVETLINNMKTYADEAKDNALGSIDSAVSSVTGIADELVWDSGLSSWSYEKVSTKAYDLLEALNITKTTTSASKPNTLGDFSGLPNADTYTKPTILANTRTALHTLYNAISLIPERLTQAIIMFDTVNNKVLSDLINGGYGIDPADEEALWQRTRDRESIAANIALDELRNKFSAYGIPIPQGAYVAVLESALNKSQDIMSDANRDISIKRADLYRTTREKTMKFSLELANAQLGITTKKIEMMKETASAIMENIRVDIEAHKELLAVNDFNLKKIFGKQEILEKIYGSDINSWDARLNALTKTYAIIQQGSADQLNADRLGYESNVAKAKVNIEAFQAKVNIYTAALESKAHVLMAEIAGALSALNAVISQIANE
jgi:hypothetical protein